jgi:hypothetical protein
MEASMALKGRMSRTIFIANFLALDISLLLYMGLPAPRGMIASRRPILREVPRITQNFEAGTLRNIYFGDSVFLPVVQQPSDKPNYVSTNDGEVTQFSSASQYGNIGLLAHNYLSGKFFSHLAVGQEVLLEYEGGKTERFIIAEILQYRALQPKDPFSSFQNLSNKDEILSASQMFERVYAGNHHITLQTCIAKNGNSSWGRLFVVAVPEPQLSNVVH